MPRRKTQIQPKNRRRPDLPVTRDFEAFLGRTLSARERAIIWPIERLRRRHKPQPILNPARRCGSEPRFIVCDRPGEDSAPLLLDYMRYLQQCVAPVHIPSLDKPFPVLLVAARRGTAKDLLHRCGMYGFTASGARIENVRGLNYGAALLIDAESYGPTSPYNLKMGFGRVLRTVSAAVSQSPIPVLIIHMRCRMTRHKRNPRPVLPLLPQAYDTLTRSDNQYSGHLRQLQDENLARNLPIVTFIDDPPPDSYACAPPGNIHGFTVLPADTCFATPA